MAFEILNISVITFQVVIFQGWVKCFTSLQFGEFLVQFGFASVKTPKSDVLHWKFYKSLKSPQTTLSVSKQPKIPPKIPKITLTATKRLQKPKNGLKFPQKFPKITLTATKRLQKTQKWPKSTKMLQHKPKYPKTAHRAPKQPKMPKSGQNTTTVLSTQPKRAHKTHKTNPINETSVILWRFHFISTSLHLGKFSLTLLQLHFGLKKVTSLSPVIFPLQICTTLLFLTSSLFCPKSSV